MRIKTLWSMDNTRLDRKVNAFLDQNDIHVVDLKYDISMFSFSVMVVYEKSEDGVSDR